MSQEQRLCAGVEGRRCVALMSLLFRDLHTTCARYRGVKCKADVTCDICKDWFVAPIVCAVSLALQALTFPLRFRPFLPPLWLLRKLGTLRLPLVHPPLRQRGMAVLGRRRASLALALVRSPLPTPAVRWERRGEAQQGSWLLGERVTRLLLPFWGMEFMVLSLSGVNCARCLFLSSLLCLC